MELGRWVSGEQLELLFRALDDAAAYRNGLMEEGAQSCADCAKAGKTRLCEDHLSDLGLAGQYRALADDLDQMPDATTITTQRGSRVTVRGTATKVTVHQPPSDWPTVPRKPATGPALPPGRQARIVE